MENQLKEAFLNFTGGNLSVLNKNNGFFVEVDRNLFPALEIFDTGNTGKTELNTFDCIRLSKLLTEKQRDAFVLYYTGHSMAAIAARFGVSKSTIQDRLKSARATLERFKCEAN